MTPNSAQVNFDPLNPTDWEKSTYYSRDAQGNVMAIYEYTVVDSTQQNNYTLTERNIYGSNRLGNNNEPVEMIAAPPIDTSKYVHYVGHRQYELSNHLGNVMSVISDRKIARDTSANDTVDYYEPDVLLTFDYSPFGAPLHARSFTKEVCHDTTFTMTQEDLNTNFDDGTTQGWQALSTTPILSVVNSKLRVQKQGGGSGQLGVEQSFMATSGLVYNFSITIENDFNSNSTIVLELIDPNNNVIYTQSLPKSNPPPNTATYNYQFTASATGSYTIKVYRTGPNSSGSFYMDDVLVTHEEEVTQILCDDFGASGTGKYRYGFNGMEKDDEVNGITGSSYTAEYWQYDSRLGRRWNRDPVIKPWESPYATFRNNPIFFIDPSGLDGVNPQEDSKGDAGTTAPNGGTRNGEGGVTGGGAYCPGCGSNGEDIYGIPGETPPNPAPVDNTYVKTQVGTGGRSNEEGSYGKGIFDIFRDIENMFKGGLVIMGDEKNPTFALKVGGKGNRDTPWFDFSGFKKIVDEASSAISRMDNLKTPKDIKDVAEKLDELSTALQNGTADDIKEKVIEVQAAINRVDVPEMDYATKVQFFGYPQPDEEGFIYSEDSLYRYQIYGNKPDTAYTQKKGNYCCGAKYWVVNK